MPRLISFDLGSHAVKATLFQLSGRNQLELVKRYEHVVPQDGVAPGLEQRLAALDALLDDTPTLKPSSADVALLAWPSNEAAFHRVAMPFTDKAQIERTLPFAVENEVPFELDEMVLAWRIAEQREQSQVLAALARRSRVAEWLAALAQRGIDPEAVHIDADVFGPWGAGVPVLVDEAPTETGAPPSSPLVIVLDIGHLHTAVSVIRDAAVQYARSINIGGYSFTRAIAEGLSIPFKEAENLKHAGYSALPDEARSKLDASLALLVAEVRSTLIKAEDSLGAEVIEVRVCGGSAAMPEILGYLHADLGVSVVLAADPRAPGNDTASSVTPPSYAVSHALAYTKLNAAATGAVNLRVGELAHRGRADIVRSALVYGVAGALCFSFAALLMFAFQYRSLMAEQAEIEASVREIVHRSFPEVPDSMLESMGKAEAAMAQLTQDAVQRADVLGDGTVAVPPTIDALYHLTLAFPPHPDVTVEVSDLTITASSITLNAETDGFQSSSKVEEKLKEDPRFHAATKGQEQKLANGHVRFPITIPLGEAAAASGEENTKAGEEG